MPDVIHGLLHGAADLANQFRFPYSIHGNATRAGESVAAKNLGRHGQDMLRQAQKPVDAAKKQVDKAVGNQERYNSDRAADLARVRSERAINKTRLNMANASGDATAVSKANQEISQRNIKNKKTLDTRRANAHQARNDYRNAMATHRAANETYESTMRPLLDQQQRSFQHGYNTHVAQHRYHNLKVLGGTAAVGTAGLAGLNAMRPPQQQYYQ